VSSNLKQTPCDNPDSPKTCCNHKEDTTSEELKLSPEPAIETTPDEATDMTPKELAPKLDPPVATPKQCAPKCKCKAKATAPPRKSRLPNAVVQYYLQFGFTPKAVHAILHSPPQDLTNKKVSFVSVTPPKNC
jgi:hypothetical protein